MPSSRAGSVLIVFPHGIGDLIMATPALRALRRRKDVSRVAIAVQPLVWNSGVAHSLTSIDEVFQISNPWSVGAFDAGMARVRAEVAEIGSIASFDRTIYVLHRQPSGAPVHKLFLVAQELGVGLDGDTRYEAPITEEQERAALEWLAGKGWAPGQYAFVHTFSSDVRKNARAGELLAAARDRFGERLVTVARSLDPSARPLSFSSALLKHAGFIALVDSVFVHVADALGKDIDMHLTEPGIEAVNRPLHVERRRIIMGTFGERQRLLFRIDKAIRIARGLLVKTLRKTGIGRGIASDLVRRIHSVVFEPNGMAELARVRVGIVVAVLWLTIKEKQYIVKCPAVFVFESTGTVVKLAWAGLAQPAARPTVTDGRPILGLLRRRLATRPPDWTNILTWLSFDASAGTLVELGPLPGSEEHNRLALSTPLNSRRDLEEVVKRVCAAAHLKAI